MNTCKLINTCWLCTIPWRLVVVLHISTRNRLRPRYPGAQRDEMHKKQSVLLLFYWMSSFTSNIMILLCWLYCSLSYKSCLFVVYQISQGRSWSWSYRNWFYHYLCNQYLLPLTLWVRISLRQGALGTTLWDKACQWLATGSWFSAGTPVSSTNNTDQHDISEILLKVA